MLKVYVIEIYCIVNSIVPTFALSNFRKQKMNIKELSLNKKISGRESKKVISKDRTKTDI